MYVYIYIDITYIYGNMCVYVCMYTQIYSTGESPKPQTVEYAKMFGLSPCKVTAQTK